MLPRVFGQLFQPAPGPGGLPANLSGWMANPSVVPHPSAAPSGPIGLGSPNNAGCLFIVNALCYIFNVVIASIHENNIGYLISDYGKIMRNRPASQCYIILVFLLLSQNFKSIHFNNFI